MTNMLIYYFKFDIVELPIKQLIIFNNVVDVACKSLIDNVELVDKLFNLIKYSC